MTTQELINYYAGLLILQYIGQPRAYANIQAVVKNVLMPQTTQQTISFSPVPTAGTFKLTYGAFTTGTLNWNDSASTIQTALQLLTGLGSVTVSGSIASGALVVSFVGVPPVATLLLISNNTLTTSGVTTTPIVTETDVQLPLSVQNAFNMLGGSLAQGVQLDVLGKYANVTRNGYGLNGTPITLNDADFLQFIRMTIIKNSSGSSLATIQDFLHQYFNGSVLVFDYKDMRMSYFLNSNIGSQQLAQIFVTSGTLPKPMAVQLGSVIFAPNITSLFGFRSYEVAGFNVTGFNNYASYSMASPWLSYKDALN
jgi:hypothetical protein